MKRRDIYSIVVIGLIAALFSFFLSGFLFKTPSKRVTKVPYVEPIDPTFPDVRNDTAYNRFLNDKALDPTQPVPLGAPSNNSPFESR